MINAFWAPMPAIFILEFLNSTTNSYAHIFMYLSKLKVILKYIIVYIVLVGLIHFNLYKSKTTVIIEPGQYT